MMLAAEMAEKEQQSSSSHSACSKLDPLLWDLPDKKRRFHRSVVSLASNLKDVTTRLAQQQKAFALENLSRKAAETKAKSIEEHICLLNRSLEGRNQKLQESTSYAQKSLEAMEEHLATQLSTAQAAADASAASAQSAQNQCLSLMKELDEKNSSIKERENQVVRLGQQLDVLQNDLEERELSQKQLKDEVVMHAIAKTGDRKDTELMRILEEVSPKNIGNMNKHLNVKDDEIARLRGEMGFLTSHWKHKTKDLESQIEKHRRTDQELKKRILKLESCLKDARSQTRKLQRMGEKRDRALEELKEQLSIKQQNVNMSLDKRCKHNIWERPGFKMLASISMLGLVVFF